MYRGKVIGEYIYNAWGEVEIKIYEDTNPSSIDRYVIENNPFRYKGYYYDKETKLYYCNARYYNPDIYEWLTPDDIGYLDIESVNGLNLYCYCGNNPIMYYDPTGYSAIVIGLIVGAIVGAIIGFGIAAYIDYQDDGQIFNGSVEWYDYLGATVLGGVIGAAIGAGIGYIAPYIGSAFSSFAAQEFTIGAGAYITTTGELAMTTGLTFTSAQVIGVAGTLTLGGLMLYSEHTKGTRPSTKDKHEKGQARKARDQKGFIKKPPRKIIKKEKWANYLLWWLYYKLFVEE